MALFKPKGKHAQPTGKQPVITTPETPIEPDAEKEGRTVDSAEIPPVKDAPPIRIEDYYDMPAEDALGEAGGSNADSSSETAVQPAVQPAVSPMPVMDAYAPNTLEGIAAPKKRRVGKVVGITFGVILGVFLVAYIAGAVVFMNMLFPNTTIVGKDLSMMSNDEAAEVIQDAVDGYALDVAGNGFSYHTKAADIGLTVDAKAVIDSVHADLSPWAWPVMLFQGAHDESGMLKVSFKQGSYETAVKKAIEDYNKDAVAPTNATISYDEATKKFKIVPEVAGTQYDSKTVLAAMDDAISTLDSHVKLTSEHLIQPTVLSTDERLVNSAELATGLVSAHVTLMMVGQKVAEIDGGNLSAFVHMDDSMGVTLDEAALDQWVTDLSNSFDTVGTERTYTRPDGKEITVKGGAYGWLTDAPELKDQVVAAVKAGQTTTIDIPCQQEAAEYKGAGKPDWGSRYIDVDLSEQYVRFFDGGNIIWESACISGSPDGEHNTWPGVWYITNKQAPSKLIGYLPSGEKEYETTVAYWMAFEGNGIGLHDATWQPSFGGSMYANGYGSHGCVNLPYGAAEELYGICNVGDPVIAHY